MITMFMARVVLKEKLSWAATAAGCLSFIGVLFIAQPSAIFGEKSSASDMEQFDTPRAVAIGIGKCVCAMSRD